MAIERHDGYEFVILSHDVPGHGEDSNKWVKGYYYIIYDPEYYPSPQTEISESMEYFETEQEARYAAIGHISLIQKGVG